MSGHSKWATTKRAKAVVDAKRSNLFTKLSKNIIVAAKEGADPASNSKLRLAIDKARVFSMPKDNIERAIKRAVGGGEDAKIETLFYEAYGPESVAVLIEVLTDNKNRSASSLKHILSKYGGKLGGEGSVRWMFTPQGQITLGKNTLTEAEQLIIIEAGAQDIIEDEQIKILTHIEDLDKVRHHLQQLAWPIVSAELIYIAKDKLVLQNPEKFLEFLDELDNDDDVNNIFTNADI